MTYSLRSRRKFLRDVGVSSALLPFVMNLPSFGKSRSIAPQRLVILFSPNGIVPWEFWPEEAGPLNQLKTILSPLEEFKDRMLVLHGVNDQIRGDGDAHMRGIGCLLTGIELYPGNIQGGSDTPAGWASGRSIDQELRNYLQSNPETETRFGSLEFGVGVPDRADTWTRMVYRGPNKPVAPIDDPRQMFKKLYGDRHERAILGSVLDDLVSDLEKLKRSVSSEDQKILDQHTTIVRELELELSSESQPIGHAIPEVDPSLEDTNDNIPELTRVQMDLLISAFLGDFTRIATFQFTNSVGQAKMRWLSVDEGHHELSHEPDDNQSAQEKLIKINRWYCEQMAYLVRSLAETPDPLGGGSLLDHSTVLWTNELGKGNSHTLDNIPFVLVGNGLPFQMGRSLKLGGQPHNRLLMAIAHGMGHHIEHFGNPDYCRKGPLELS